MTSATASRRVYLDHNATAPLRPEARVAALDALAVASNPSSVHAEGRRARAIIDDARTHVAALVGGSAERVTFTSSATEAACLALAADLSAEGRTGFARLIVASTEHAAVLRGHRFAEMTVTTVPVLTSGLIDLDALTSALAEGGRPIVALQAANNETGVIQPVAQAAEIARRAGGILVCDAVQAAGRVPCCTLPADIALLSGHKLGGLAGAGAVVVLREDVGLGRAVLRGGNQERGYRAGTENVAAIAAFGAAAKAAATLAGVDRLAILRDRFESALLQVAPGTVVFGCGAPRLPNTSAFSVPGVEADRLVIALDLAGIAVSSGSACASGVVGRSHVLEGMGVTPDLRRGAVRVSLGWSTTETEIDRAIESLASALLRIGQRRFRTAA